MGTVNDEQIELRYLLNKERELVKLRAEVRCLEEDYKTVAGMCNKAVAALEQLRDGRISSMSVSKFADLTLKEIQND